MRWPRVRPVTAWRRMPLPLALLLAVAATLSISWSFAFPLLQGPDEAEHVGTIEHLATTGHLQTTAGPDLGGAYSLRESTLLTFGFFPLLQNRIERPPWSKLQEQQFEALERSLPANASETAGGPTPTAKNPPLYYAYSAVLWKLTPGGIRAHIQVVRWGSCLLLLITVLMTWLAAGEAFGRRRVLQTFAAGVAALQPMTGAMSGLVNPDIALAAVWSAFLWQGLRTVRIGPRPREAALLSLLTVLSVLVHGRGLALVPALGLVLLIAWIRHRPGLKATAAGAAASGGTMVAGFAVYRLLAAPGGQAFGGEVNLGSVFSFRELLSSIWQFYLPQLQSMAPRPGPAIGYRQIVVDQFFGGTFANNEVYFRPGINDLVQVGVGLLAIILFTVLVAHFDAVKRHWAQVLTVAVTGLSLALFLHVASYRALANGSDNPLITGRYLLALTPILGLATAAIVAGLGPRIGRAVGVAVLSALFALSVGGLAITIERFYA